MRQHRFARSAILSVLTLLILLTWQVARPAPVPASQGSSLRFFGTGAGDLDRVKIPLGPISNGQITASRPVNVGGDFTIEFWMRAAAADNSAPACPGGWYIGNIVIDRDVFEAGDYGDYGIAICDGRIVFGVAVGSDDRLLVGNTVVTTNTWRHIAVTRSNDGVMRIFVDGALDASRTGPTGRIDYRLNRETNWPNSDPYLVLAAEKHDYPGSRYYTGLLDDLRISNSVRYSAAFTRPNSPHPADANTVALYRFDEGAGTAIGDSSGAAGGPSNGALNPRGGGPAQHWSSDTPFSGSLPPPPPPSPGPSPSPGPNPSPGPSPSPGPNPSPSPAPPIGCVTGRTNATSAGAPPVTPIPQGFDTRAEAANARFRIYLPLVACLTG
ncbi:MAG: LamG domain-containing protein [Chloroflexaceae bacterium]|nr:LamG domain-containing protein [Chloroflexaceae bacterium]